MKTGILTFHKSVNYGSVLQTWAMQELLRKEGYDVEVIDYEPQKYKNHYNTYLKTSNIKSILKNAARIPISKYMNNQSKLFANFRESRLHLSEEKYFSYSDFRKLENIYDCIVCGSDQIWNVHAMDCDDVYYLPNIATRKIAYAVSINNTLFTEPRCNDDMKHWITDFSFISCRESAGAERIAKFIGEKKEVFTVLDPTLLHKKEVFDSIIHPSTVKEEYIFLYKVWSGVDGYIMAKSYGKQHNLPVYSLFMSKDFISLCKIEKQGIRVIKDRTAPEDYLSLIKNASYVITDSFHGTAFSIIFEKNVICVKEKRANGEEKNDERIINLLDTLDIRNRYISLSSIDQLEIVSDLDYTKITKKRLERANIDKERLIGAIECR